MKMIPLFPQAIAQFELANGLTEEEITFITTQPSCQNMYNITSENNYLLNSKQLSRLQQFFVDSIDEYVDKIICPASNVNIAITQSWANYTQPGQGHHQHKHPNSYISCVFFVQTDSSKDRIYFVKEEYTQILVESKNYNEFNSPSWWLEAAENTLYIFPSSLTHFVDRVQTETTRISISCNTFPVGVLGNTKNLTELVVRNVGHE
jgi:uncharacterized protein (TIGR02466 family)